MDTVIFIAYFDFSGSAYRKAVLCKTLASLGEDVDIFLVCHGLEIDESILSISRNIRVFELPQASILWQKERFFNIALSNMAEHHTYVAWLDADVVFTDPSWKEQLKEKLKDFHLVQLFCEVEDRYPEGEAVRSGRFIRKSVATFIENGTLTTDYFCKSGVSLKLGCSPGFGWGIKASTIRQLGFPDHFILGSGDKAILASGLGHHALYGDALHLNTHLRNHYMIWSEKAYRAIQGKVSYLENSIHHLVQGDYENRGYGNRYRLLQENEFSIEDYLRMNEYGAWQWKNDDNKYALRIREYFEQRGD